MATTLSPERPARLVWQMAKSFKLVHQSEHCNVYCDGDEHMITDSYYGKDHERAIIDEIKRRYRRYIKCDCVIVEEFE